ncbi:hypothetical protein N7453_004591 [Penicillium expansum]|nr:hypothetical protein N7453_004591 [Penicillium expansum]
MDHWIYSGTCHLGPPGYTVSTTNGDYAADSGPEWALNAEGSVNLHLQGFASLALHELAVIGKLITGDISR